MPSYKYTAYTKEGKEKKGSIEADDKDAAVKLIKAEGNTPIKIEEEGLMDKDLNFSFGGKKATSRDLSILDRKSVV